MGAPYDTYSLGDLNKVDFNKYKLFIFIESLLLTDEQRELINKLKSLDKIILFIGPVDYANNGISGVENITNMKLAISDELENRVITNNSSFGYYNKKKDNFYIIDNSEALGRYEKSNLVAFAKKDNVLFTGMGNLDYKTLQLILKIADVHIYVEDGEGTYVCNNFIGVYSPFHKEIIINLKEDGEFEEIFTGYHYISKDKKIKLDTSNNIAQMILKVS